jgi:hypothetical protein
LATPNKQSKQTKQRETTLNKQNKCEPTLSKQSNAKQRQKNNAMPHNAKQTK